MGCDIHLYVERRNADGAWESADQWETEEDGYKEVPYLSRFYSGRNYDLFAILADVRNGRGIVPICEPRGLPADVCQEIDQIVKRWSSDGHSHSFMTVAEIMDYDWTQKQKHRGIVPFEEFSQWSGYSRARGEAPGHYYIQIGSEAIISMAEGDAILDAARQERDRLSLGGEQARQQISETIKAHSNKFVDCEWEESYFAMVGPFLSRTMPKLWRLGKTDDVRIVFFFDN